MKAQGFGAIGEGIGKIRTSPVEHRHKIVSNDMDAALSQVAQTFFIILDVFPKVASLGFDMFVYRDTLYYRPFQADRFDQFLS